jgi:hypothetical protein
MPYYNDPQEVHGGECIRCHGWFADNEEDLDANDRCNDCAEEAEAEEAEERAREEESANEGVEPLSLAKPASTDWFGLASHILEPWK